MSSSDLPKLLRTPVNPVHKYYLCTGLTGVLNNLVGLTMTRFSEKRLFRLLRCICDFMPNLHKKSWMVSNTYSQTNFLWPYYLCMKVKWRSDFCCLLCTIDFLSCEHEGFKLELTLFSCNGYLVFNFIVKSAEFQLLANKQLSRGVWLLKEG